MARGWESKSVESQQAEALEKNTVHKRALSPAEVAIVHRREGLMLSRQRVLDQMEHARNPRHRQMLESALADLDAQLAALP